ncbi:hypothetical protein CDA63_13085 [Hymenobacter amundsenii]|uniref:Uncharacterized protein n=1 Tax=Hymenobacter amundsenii TaxID=2006685 RepID=A0A246FJH6_9BACT|nr:hypothetical protein [Hymenobacter amundsenii]OWP62702.1 hypothetical protein CDA63_13085 [Hymenobacter amundsenii]
MSLAKPSFSSFTILLPLLGNIIIIMTSCSDDSKPLVQPNIVTSQNVIYQLEMKGYAAEPAIVVRFGVANSEAEARQGKAAQLTGKILWADTKGGKETKDYELANQAVGSKKWVFLSTSKKPVGTQSVTLNWLISKSLTLNASSGDTLVVQEYTVE